MNTKPRKPQYHHLDIDWDFFFQENPLDDHSETSDPTVTDVIWQLKLQSALLMGVDLYEQSSSDETKIISTFWDDITFDLGASGIVADSHAVIGRALDLQLANVGDDRELVLWHVDAHHDLFYESIEKFEIRMSKLFASYDAGNWLGVMVASRFVGEVRLVLPAWRLAQDDQSERLDELIEYFQEEYSANIELATLAELTKQAFSSLSIAQSSVWSMPWYDAKFLRWLKACPVPLEYLDDPIWRNRGWTRPQLRLLDGKPYPETWAEVHEEFAPMVEAVSRMFGGKS